MAFVYRSLRASMTKKFQLIFWLTVFGLGLVGMLLACGRKAVKEALSQEAVLAKAIRHFERRKYFEATEQFQKYIFNYPGSTGIDTAEFYLGLSQFNQDEFILAMFEFRKVLTSYPNSPFADDAQFYIGECHFNLAPVSPGNDQSELDSAIAEYQTLIDEYPTSPYGERARQQLTKCMDRLAKKSFDIALLYYKLYDFNAAVLSFQDLLDNYSTSKYVPEGLYYLATSLEKSGRASEACDKFRAYLQLFPNEKRAVKVRELISRFCPEQQDSQATSPK